MQATSYLSCRYFDAPGAGMASLQGRLQQTCLPQITVVFCGIEQADVMQVPVCPMHPCGPASPMTFICCMHTTCDANGVQSPSSQKCGSGHT